MSRALHCSSVCAVCVSVVFGWYAFRLGGRSRLSAFRCSAKQASAASLFLLYQRVRFQGLQGLFGEPRCFRRRLAGPRSATGVAFHIARGCEGVRIS